MATRDGSASNGLAALQNLTSPRHPPNCPTSHRRIHFVIFNPSDHPIRLLHTDALELREFPPRGKSPSTPSCHTPGRMKRSSSKMHATAATVCFPVGSRASTNWSRAPPRRARTAISTSGTTPAASTSRAAPNCTARSPKIDLRHRFKVPGAPDASSTNTSDKDKHSSAIVYGASIYYYRGGLAGFVLVWGRADTASSNTASSGGSQKSEDEPPWMLEIYVPLGT